MAINDRTACVLGGLKDARSNVNGLRIDHDWPYMGWYGDNSRTSNK